jgi:hypothetical protein
MVLILFLVWGAYLFGSCFQLSVVISKKQKKLDIKAGKRL